MHALQGNGTTKNVNFVNLQTFTKLKKPTFMKSFKGPQLKDIYLFNTSL